MQVKLNFLLILMLLASCIACNNTWEDSTPPAENVTYIKFVSPTGTNVLDSLQVFDFNSEYKKKKMDDDLISITGDRKSDGKILEIDKYLTCVCPYEGANLVEETLLELKWWDYNIFDVDKQEYTIALKSKKVFGDDDMHYLKWYVNVFGSVYDAYKCEFDGHEVSLADDPVYNANNKGDHHFLKAKITVQCKYPTE